MLAGGANGYLARLDRPASSHRADVQLCITQAAAGAATLSRTAFYDESAIAGCTPPIDAATRFVADRKMMYRLRR